jgi:imidazoleglycerol-phosphate dehydratase/histidinol-phosphatase
MDDCLAQVAIDFEVETGWFGIPNSNARWWGNANRDVLHFFKSFSDGAKANINIKAEGQNEHHKIEAILRLSPKRSR